MSLKPSSTLPPITRGIDPKKYHSLGAAVPRGDARKIMSNSELKKFASCPSRWIRGHEQKETDSLEWGSLLDCIVLTPDKFESVYSICPETYPAEGKKGAPIENKDWNWNANYCKEWRKCEEALGKTAVKPELCSEAHSAKARIMADPLLKEFLRSSDTQVQICVDYHDSATGMVIPIKCLLDLVPREDTPFGTMLGDMKSACDGLPYAWAKAVFKQGYHAQAALYTDAFNVVTGQRRNVFAHVIQENFAPYETARRILGEEYLSLGRDAYRSALQRYCRCLKTGEWPGLDEADGMGQIIAGWRIVDPEAWMIMPE